MALWIDTDMGGDDIFAVLLAMQGAEVAGLSLTFGNAPLAQVARNAAGAAEAFGWRLPIALGADRALLGGAETAERILGPTGIPTRGAALPDAARDMPAALPALTAWLEDDPAPELLALGPLTNLAVLALARPDLTARLRRVTWMGGAVGAGNHTASAEFNAFADPEAVAVALSRGLKLRMIDLDACRRVQIAEGDVTAVRAAPGPRAGLLADLLGGYLDIALTRGRASMALYDPVAAAAAVRPDLFAFAPARVEAECAGRLTRGRTVTDLRPAARPNAEIVASLDADAVRALCLGALRGAA